MSGFMSDLEVELASAGAAMPIAAIRQLEAMGVARATAFALHLSGDLGVAMVEVSPDGRRWSPGGPDRRLLLGVRECGALVDALAISSTARSEWALRCDAGVMLGHDLWLAAALEGRGRLRLHGTPMEWLAAGGDAGGICILDWTTQALGMLRQLGEGVTLVCDDAAARERLRGVLAHGGLPRLETARGAPFRDMAARGMAA